MPSKLLPSYERLGLAPGASLREIEAAYRDMCELYGEASLATYSLFDFAERQEKLADLKDAYEALVQSHLSTAPESTPPATRPPPARTVVAPITCDPHSEPGRYLQQHRERLGLSLHDVAERTKIGSYHLRNIEDQVYSKLPAPVYLRGFIREFARAVGLDDAETLIDRFLELIATATPDRN